MDPSIPYLACVIGAAALFVMLRPAPGGATSLRLAAGLVGVGVFIWLIAIAARLVGHGADEGAAPEAFFLIFSVIAVASAVRMITHGRPVYSALYFIMVVLSSAALFLMLQAEFMAFALVIVYAGAILITYLFVLMLAQQSPDPADPRGPQAQPEYDRVPREPLAAAVVGFIMLALLTHMVYGGAGQLAAPPSAQAAQARVWRQLELMPAELDRAVRSSAGADAAVQRDANGKAVHVEGDVVYVMAMIGGEAQARRVDLPAEAMPTNVQLVGLDLVAKFPVSLELAGVILLMAMFGAVVLARKQIEMGEDEVREAAGMPRLDLHVEAGEAAVDRGAAR
jgi:NADH-quinone oxidoreductase subunit J